MIPDSIFIGGILFARDEQGTFTVNNYEVMPMELKEWQEFYEATSKLCKCGGSCGCQR